MIPPRFELVLISRAAGPDLARRTSSNPDFTASQPRSFGKVMKGKRKDLLGLIAAASVIKSGARTFPKS